MLVEHVYVLFWSEN